MRDRVPVRVACATCSIEAGRSTKRRPCANGGRMLHKPDSAIRVWRAMNRRCGLRFRRLRPACRSLAPEAASQSRPSRLGRGMSSAASALTTATMLDLPRGPKLGGQQPKQQPTVAGPGGRGTPMRSERQSRQTCCLWGGGTGTACWYCQAVAVPVAGPAAEAPGASASSLRQAGPPACQRALSPAAPGGGQSQCRVCSQ
jgi:hypothetical protein